MTVQSRDATVLVVMGVSGVGKSTVGEQLAVSLGWPFYDADDFHPEANKEKMRAGRPLDDADRWGWLQRLRDLIRTCLGRGQSAVVACSALRAAYRDLLAGDVGGDVVFVYLKASRQVVHERMTSRTDHFMNPALLESQFATLEEPVDAVVVDAAQPPEVIVDAVRASLARRAN